MSKAATKKRLPYWFWVVIVGALLAGQIFAYSIYTKDQRYLERVMDRIAAPSLPPSEQVLRVLDYLREKPVITNDSYFLLPIFGFMRATGRDVDEQGGDCADRARLMITLLDLRGIRAAKWALYSPRSFPRHAVVQVDTEKGPMVADGLFGIVYPRPEGGYYGIADLRHTPSLVPQRIHDLEEHRQEPGAVPLEQYPLDIYIYTHARSINWDKTDATLILYSILHAILGDRVDWLVRPKWVEQPALMLIFGLGALQAFVLSAWFVGARRRRIRPSMHASKTNAFQSPEVNSPAHPLAQ
jgi:hypothetical protein